MQVDTLWSRRRILSAGLAAIGARSLAGAPGKSIFRGVSLGVQSRSFQDRPFDEAVAAMAHVGFSVCELSGVHFQPQAPAAEARKCRLSIGTCLC